MSWIDVAIASLVVVSALRGWSRGLLRQVGALLGRALGLVGGAYLAVHLVSRITKVAWRPLDAVLIVAVTTLVGGLLMRFAGGIFSDRLHENRLGLVDSLLGASVGVVGTLLTCWFVAAIVTVVPWGTLGPSINRSLILREVGRVLPPPPAIASELQGVLDQLNVPSLFARVVAPSLPGVAHGALTTTHHVTDPAGVVTVEASGGCAIVTLDSGFVVAPGEVVTTAHALAGQKRVVVDSRPGQVVLFDPRRDVAVLRVTGLVVTPITVGADLVRGARGQLMGFAAGHDRVSSSVIALGTLSAPGRDIYSGAVFTRTVSEVITTMSPSESGAPILVHGAVAAVAVARAVYDTSLVYAVPATQVRQDLALVSPRPVSTGRCVN